MPDLPDHARYVAPANLLAGRNILVTGATSGIGRAVARGLTEHGANTILLGRQEKALESLYQELRDLGPEPTVAVLDFQRAQGDAYMTLVEQIESRYQHLDGLLLNAAILGERSAIEHYDIATWQKVMHVNVNAQFILTRCLLPLLLKSDDASIVFTTSGVGYRGRAFWGAYAASKFALEGLAQVLADELRNTSVRVNCINPGRTRTRMRAHAYPGEDPLSVPLPESHLPSYLFLLGPASQGINGERLECQ